MMGRFTFGVTLLISMLATGWMPAFPADPPATSQKPVDKPPQSPPAKSAEKSPGNPAANPPKAAPPKVDEKTSVEKTPGTVAPVKAVVRPPAPTNAADLEAFFDGAMRVQLESKHIAGAVVAVVVGDKLVFAKGYGYSDVEALKAVDPQTTMFRVGSVTKLFTWTAVMQLVEEGKLDLDADVNIYLKSAQLQVPTAFDKPVTLRNLLTHTPGFEDRVIGLFAHQASDVKPLAEVLKNDMPARVRPPGILAAYSNHGSALAGLVVASVAGKTWEEVIEQRLLNPLQMKNTLVRQPPEEKLPDTMSRGYKWEDGRYKTEEFEYVPLAPAGAMSASAADMAHFMIAHLNAGRYQDVQILKPETTRRMHERLFAHDPRVDGMCYGFLELHQNGQRIIQHGGATLVFHSLLAMIPEQRVGLFLSYNTDRGAGEGADVLAAFLDRYYPATAETPPNLTADSDPLKRFEGEYGTTRYSQTTYAKLIQLLQSYSVKASDGTLSINLGEPRRYAQIEPLVFQEVGGRRKVVFHEDDQGRITQFYVSPFPVIAAVRQSGLDQPRLHQGLLAACTVLFLTSLLFWPALAFSMRGWRSSKIRRSPLSGVISVAGWLLAVACLAFLAGVVVVASDPNQIVYGTPREAQYLLLLPQVCVGLAAVASLCSIVAWAKGYWRFSGRLHYTLVALAGIGFVWFLHHWNLLTFGAEVLAAKS
jgi:CubicO group peptidase (beta-lactamase class C family)